MRRIFWILVVLFLLPVWKASAAASDSLLFEETHHNFGTIARDTTVTHTFTFTNQSANPVQILGMEASCGCTTTAYTQHPVDTGEKGFIRVQFNSAGRTGKFRKTIKVSLTNRSTPLELVISGKVAFPEISGSDIQTIGNIRVSERELDIGNIVAGRSYQKKVTVQNMNYFPITIKEIQTPRNVSAEYAPQTLLKGDTTTITVSLESDASIDPGEFREAYILKTNDQDQATKKLYVRAFVNGSLSTTATGPEIEFDTTVVDLGEIKLGNSKDAIFHFTNTGNKTLKLRSSRATCGCTIAEIRKIRYEPGEEGALKVIFHAYQNPGPHTNAIQISTNAASRKKVELKVTAFIVN